MEIKIETKVPVPANYNGGRGKYPFAKMKIGESFYVATKDCPGVRSSANQYHQIHKDFTFTVRAEKDGYRVWRIANR